MRVITLLITTMMFTVFHLPGHCQVIDLSELGPERDYIYINKETSFLKFSSLISADSAKKEFETKTLARLPNEDIIFRGYDPAYYWFRFIMHNRDTVSKNLILMQSGFGTRDSELWKSITGKWISLGKTGYKYPFDKRPYPNPRYCFPITIDANTIDTFFLKVDDSHVYKVNGFVLNYPPSLKKKEVTFYFLFGTMIGLLVLFMLINVYLYVAIKEKIHLWYSAYLLFSLFFLIKNEGIDSQFFGFDSELAYRISSMGAISVLAIALMVQFAQLFLSNISNQSFLFKVMSVVKWSGFISGLIYWLVFYIQPAYIIEEVVYQWGQKTLVISLFIVPVACIYSYLKGYKPALLILCGMAFLLAGAMARAIYEVKDSYLFPPSAFEIGMVIEAIFISFVLMYRYNIYKREKEKLQLELEFQKREAATQVLAVQEAEQKRIAEDLHDELGGNLATIKMTLQRFNLPEIQSAELNHLIDKASINARNISHNLMPPEFAETNLKDLMENNFRRLNTESDTHFYFHYTGSNNHFDKQEELMIYRIIMELTNNIIKHAKATESTIQFIYHEKHLALVIEDNGKGFYNDSSKGIGLKNIQSRVNYLNGSLDIDSGNHGTTIMIQIPYKDGNEKN